MTNSEKQTRLDFFELCNIADADPRSVWGRCGDWFTAIRGARRASVALFNADVRHANTNAPTERAERAARRACDVLNELFTGCGVDGWRQLRAEIVAPGGGLRYIRVAFPRGVGFSALDYSFV